jgi:predicted phage replisome organizer
MSNHKIKRIRKMPDGNSIVLIWVFLLAQAGESNKSGALYFTDTIPYNLDGLAIQFDFSIDVIKLALNVLEKFEMIEIFEDVIYIKNWSEYQNIDGLERIREQTRLRVSKYKQNKKLLADSNVSGNATVTQGNATELDIDKDNSIINNTCPNSRSDDSKKLKFTFEHESNSYKLALKLSEMIHINNPEAKEQNEVQYQSWARTFDLMERIDKRTPKKIYDVMFFAENDDFWRKNILSASALRDKYDKLKLTMEG